MDVEVFRASWEKAEFEERFLRMVPPEVPLQFWKTAQGADIRASRWRKINRYLVTGIFVLLCIVMGLLPFFDLLYHKESLHQTLCSMAAITVFWLLARIERKRDKYALPPLHLSWKEYLVEEQNRLEAHIRLDRRASWLLTAAIVSVAVYFAPLVAPASVQVVYASVMLGLIVGCRLYDRWRITEQEETCNDLAELLDGLLRDGE